MKTENVLLLFGVNCEVGYLSAGYTETVPSSGGMENDHSHAIGIEHGNVR